MFTAIKFLVCAAAWALTTQYSYGLLQNGSWVDRMTAGQDVAGPSGVLTGPFGRPRAVLDEFGSLRLPIVVFSDAQVEEFVPDITDPNSTRLAEFKNCGTYTVMLYMYDKEKEGTRRYTLSVNASGKSATIMEGVGFTELPKTFALSTAPPRISRAAANITAILSKEISHPTPVQRRNWDSMAAACATAHPLAPDTGESKRSAEQSNVDIPGRVYQIGGEVSAPAVTFAPEPEYPLEAKKKKIGGKVLVDLLVDTNGMPSKIHVVKALGHGLDEEAVAAVEKYRFKPATKNGLPVIVNLRVSIVFQIF